MAKYCQVIMFAVVLISCTSSRIYFNTYYNADKYFRKGIQSRETRLERVVLDAIWSTEKEKKLFKKAIRKSKKILSNYSDKENKYLEKSLFIIGRSYYYLGLFENSIEYLEKLEHLYPNTDNKEEIDVTKYLAKLLLGIITKREQQQSYQAVIRFVKNKKLSRNFLFEYLSFLYQKEWVELIESFSRDISDKISLNKVDKNKFTYYRLFAFYKQKKWQETVSEYRNLDLETLPNNFSNKALFYYLEASFFTEDKKEVIAFLNKYIEDKKDDDISEIRYLLAKSYLQVKDTLSYYKQLEIIVENEKKDSIFILASYILGKQFYFVDGDTSLANKYLNLAVAQPISTKDRQQAKKTRDDLRLIFSYQDLIASRPLFYYYHIAEIFYFNLDRSDSAKKYLELISSSKNSASEYFIKSKFFLAKMYQENGNILKTHNIYWEIIKNYPNTQYSQEAKKILLNPPFSLQNQELKLDLAKKFFNSIEKEKNKDKKMKGYQNFLKKYPKSSQAVKAEYFLLLAKLDKFHKTNEKIDLYNAQKEFLAFSKRYSNHPLNKLVVANLESVGLYNADSVHFEYMFIDSTEENFQFYNEDDSIVDEYEPIDEIEIIE